MFMLPSVVGLTVRGVLSLAGFTGDVILAYCQDSPTVIRGPSEDERWWIVQVAPPWELSKAWAEEAAEGKETEDNVHGERPAHDEVAERREQHG